MTTNNLLRVTAIALAFTAACKSDFQAGINQSKDGSAQEAGASQDGVSPTVQDGGPPTSSVPWSCDPFHPTTKPITLANVLGAGQDTNGTLYVVDQPQADSEPRVFVSSGGTLQRQRVAGSGTESSGGGVMSYSFSVSDHVPPFMLRLETNAAGPTAMGVLQNPPLDIRTFTIGQQGSVLTLVPAAQVAGLPVVDIPAETFIEYNATLSDGRALLVVRPRDDWTFQDFRVFFDSPDHMVEQSVNQVVRYTDGGSTTINFTIDSAAAVASFPVSLTGVAAPPTLTIGATKYTLTLAPIASPPAGYSYFCLGNPPVDGGVDALSTPADGPAACRAPSPNYGPTSSFERLPNGTPAAATTCPAGFGKSAWPSSGPPNIDIALPYGTCTTGTADCSALAEVPCACGLTTGPVDGFNCSCEGGTWICRIRGQGGALCSPCPDAGVANMDQAPASDGAQNADGASPTPTNPAGLNLAGLTAVTVGVSWVPRTSDPYDACRADTTKAYSLDLQTRVLNWEHCAVDSKTAAAYRKTETQVLTDYEVTAARMLLAFLSTNYRTQCGADKDTETLDLTFGDRVEKYQDDFYGCNKPLDGRTYLANMDWIVGWLSQLGEYLNPLPISFVSLSLTSDLDPYPSSAAMTAATAACGNAVFPTYDVTTATKKLSWSSCVSSSTGYKLQTGNRVLSQNEFASVMQSWSAIQLGATGDCTTPRSLKDMALLTSPNASSIYVNDLAACNRDDSSGYDGSMYVVGLDDLSALLVSLAH